MLPTNQSRFLFCCGLLFFAITRYIKFAAGQQRGADLVDTKNVGDKERTI